MNAQHVIANLAGFDKWATLLKASVSELELSKLLFDNQDKIHLISWNDYIAYSESLSQTEFDSKLRLAIFQRSCS